MEKDYFKDRPEEIKYNKNLYKGRNVFICLKKMQPYAKEIADLTLTKITANLTSQQFHPRGQKIKGERIDTDIYGNKLYKEEYEEVVGRCTYIVDDNGWSLDTLEGKKFLIYNNQKKKLDMLPYELLKGYMKIYVILSAGDILFKIPICRYIYFKEINKVESFIENLKIENAVLSGNLITMRLNGVHIFEDDIVMMINNKVSQNKDVAYEYLCNKFNKKNNFELEVSEFVIEKIL